MIQPTIEMIESRQKKSHFAFWFFWLSLVLLQWWTFSYWGHDERPIIHLESMMLVNKILPAFSIFFGLLSCLSMILIYVPQAFSKFIQWRQKRSNSNDHEGLQHLSREDSRFVFLWSELNHLYHFSWIFNVALLTPGIWLVMANRQEVSSLYPYLATSLLFHLITIPYMGNRERLKKVLSE